jgi:hypothetical protein
MRWVDLTYQGIFKFAIKSITSGKTSIHIFALIMRTRATFPPTLYIVDIRHQNMYNDVLIMHKNVKIGNRFQARWLILRTSPSPN